MLVKFKNKRGQAVVAEYGAAILLVVAASIAMTVYFKRAVQARMRDANVYMVDETVRRTGGDFTGDLYYAYEPYYTESTSTASSSQNHNIILSGGATTGVFDKSVNDARTITSAGEILPPRDWQATNAP